MQPARIRQFEKLYRDLKADDYVVDAKMRSSHGLLLLTVILKENDEAQILEVWDKLRRTE